MPPLIIKLTELSQKILTMTKCKHQKMFFVTDASAVFPCLFINIVPEKKQIWTTSHFAMSYLLLGNHLHLNYVTNRCLLRAECGMNQRWNCSNYIA